MGVQGVWWAVVLASRFADSCSSPPWPAFTAHIVHHPNNPHSTNAKARLREVLCDEFSINPCITQQTTPELSDKIHLSGDLSVFVPSASSDATTALLFIVQSLQNHNTTTAADDLEMLLVPHDGCSESPEHSTSNPRSQRHVKLTVGRPYPIDMHSLRAFGSNSTQIPFRNFGLDLPHPQDEWERKCVEIESPGFISCQKNVPYAPQSTCVAAAAVWGFILHLQYVPNNPDATITVTKIQNLLSNRIGLVPEHKTCDSRSPRREWSTCWLPTSQPQGTPSNPFTGGVLSLYTPTDVWLNALSWATFLTHSESIDESVSVFSHPLTGCNYIDVLRWGMFDRLWPINTFGLSRTVSTQQPESDPKGNRYNAPIEYCDSAPFDNFDLYLLYNPIDQHSVDAKDSLLQNMGEAFLTWVRSGDLTATEDDPYALTKSSSPFLTAQVKIRIDQSVFADVMRWVMQNRPVEVDVLLLPDGGCPYHDFMTRSLRLGSAWPLNEFALRTGHINDVFELDSGSVDAAQDELQGTKNQTVDFNETVSDSPCSQAPWRGYVLYALYNNNSQWARSAHKAFVDEFLEYFELSPQDCSNSETSPHFPILEPTPPRLCSLNEVTDPFSDSLDPIVTPYANFFIMHDNLTTVLSWVMEHKEASVFGYEVDVLFVPVAGPLCIDAYTRYAMASGSAWPINSFAFNTITAQKQQKFISRPRARQSSPRTPHAAALNPVDE